MLARPRYLPTKRGLNQQAPPGVEWPDQLRAERSRPRFSIRYSKDCVLTPNSRAVGPALLDARYAAVRLALDAQAERVSAILARRQAAVVAFAEILLAEEMLSGTALERAIDAANAVAAEPGAA